MKMIIREATPHDIPTLIDFQLKMALETENITLEISILNQGIRKLFKDPGKGRYYVAEEGSDLAGCLMTTFEWSDWRDGTVLWIQSVYIPEKFRGQGIYKKLYGYVRQMAVADPAIKGIRLYVDKKNKDAQQVYEKLGMNGDHYQVYEWMKQS
jgi:ribosomal protein S18 acetylase RimI-like enzyme